MKRRKPLQRKTRLKAGKPPRRGAPPKRKTPLKQRGKKGSRYPQRRNKAFTAWLSRLPCVLAGRAECWHPFALWERDILSDPAHVVGTRGAGALDAGACIPLCRKHHREQEGWSATFGAKYDLAPFVTLAMEYWLRYEREHGEPVL